MMSLFYFAPRASANCMVFSSLTYERILSSCFSFFSLFTLFLLCNKQTRQQPQQHIITATPAIRPIISELKLKSEGSSSRIWFSLSSSSTYASTVLCFSSLAVSPFASSASKLSFAILIMYSASFLS
jgi:hypothetical protein